MIYIEPNCLQASGTTALWVNFNGSDCTIHLLLHWSKSASSGLKSGFTNSSPVVGRTMSHATTLYLLYLLEDQQGILKPSTWELMSYRRGGGGRGKTQTEDQAEGKLGKYYRKSLNLQRPNSSISQFKLGLLASVKCRLGVKCRLRIKKRNFTDDAKYLLA